MSKVQNQQCRDSSLKKLAAEIYCPDKTNPHSRSDGGAWNNAAQWVKRDLGLQGVMPGK